MDGDERREAIDEWLWQVVEPWQGDSADDKLARSMVGAMRALSEPSYDSNLREANQFVLGLWMDSFMKMSRSFQTLDGITQVKKSLDKDKKDEPE